MTRSNMSANDNQQLKFLTYLSLRQVVLDSIISCLLSTREQARRHLSFESSSWRTNHGGQRRHHEKLIWTSANRR